MATNSYDESANFRTEIVEDFDQSGKHVSGHRLFHDPMTGVYRCFDWNAAQQKYLAIDCPESEESHDGPKVVPKITRDEVMRDLAAARQTAQAGQPSPHPKPKDLADAPAMVIKKEVGIVLPAAMRPGQRVSGSVVVDPDRFAGYPDLLVTRTALSVEAGGAAPLDGWTIELAGSPPQPADSAISFVVPAGVAAIEFALRQPDGLSAAVSQKVAIPRSSVEKGTVPQGYLAPALCFKRDLCPVAGSFTGDSHDIFASFGSFPARIIAETDTTVFVEVPTYIASGASTLIVADGTKVAAMRMVVAEFSLEPDHDQVEAGHDMSAALNVAGIEELGDQQWQYGVYPASNLQRARTLVPGINPAKVIEHERERREKQAKQDGLHKKEEKWEESAGMVLLSVRNLTPDVGAIRGGKQSLVFLLTPDSFQMGEFKYNLNVDAAKAGAVSLHATAIPFLAPVKAEIFEPEASAKK